MEVSPRRQPQNINHARLPALDRSHSPASLSNSPIGGMIKRGMDVTIAASALFLFFPMFIFVAATIAILDGRPIFYGHSRVGFGRRTFRCFKFRTMAANGDELLRRYFQENPEARNEWTKTRKLKDDPRTTAVGAVLRKTSLDELPQLINVLRGEMSIVGPRPIVTDEIKMYGPDFAYYFRVRPGITGAWQVSGRNDSSYHQRVALDRAYAENWSLLNDVHIIIKTIPAVLTARGSY